MASGPRVADKVALVTGAGGLMGGAIALRLAEEGARVMLNDISQRRLAETVAVFQEQGYPHAALRANATERAEAEALCQAALDAFGRVDILINVVGGMRGELYTPFTELDEAIWDNAFHLNLKGIYHCARRLVPGMQERQDGRIVNLASIVYGGEAGQAHYAAAKAAVASVTRTLARELAPHIRVNALAPGLIQTLVMQRMPPEHAEHWRQRTPLGRLGEPIDIANAALFLVCDESRYITGHILPVAGGMENIL